MKTFDYVMSAILLFVTVIMVQCGGGPSKPRIRNDIYGSWAWERSCGGFDGDCIYADSVDYSKGIYISQNLTFSETYEESLIYDGPFILEDSVTAESDTMEIIVIENYPSWPGLLRLIVSYVDTDSLILREDCADCYISKYRRLFPI